MYYEDVDIPFSNFKEFLKEFSQIESENVEFVKKYNYNLTKIIRIEQETKCLQRDEEKQL